jgi:hypothetical protein
VIEHGRDENNFVRTEAWLIDRVAQLAHLQFVGHLRVLRFVHPLRPLLGLSPSHNRVGDPEAATAAKVDLASFVHAGRKQGRSSLMACTTYR